MLPDDLNPEHVEPLLAIIASVNLYDVEIVLDMVRAKYTGDDLPKTEQLVRFLYTTPDKGKRLGRALRDRYPEKCKKFVDELNELSEKEWWKSQMRRT